MIDENEDYVTKPNFKITVKAFSKYNGSNRVAVKQTNKQTQRHRKQQTYGQKNKIYTYKKTDLQWTNAHREVKKK